MNNVRLSHRCWGKELLCAIHTDQLTSACLPETVSIDSIGTATEKTLSSIVKTAIPTEPARSTRKNGRPRQTLAVVYGGGAAPLDARDVVSQVAAGFLSCAAASGRRGATNSICVRESGQRRLVHHGSRAFC